jgi:hypothetical protein
MIGHNGNFGCTKAAWYETANIVKASFKDAHRTDSETALDKFLGDGRGLPKGSLCQVWRVHARMVFAARTWKCSDSMKMKLSFPTKCTSWLKNSLM